MTTAQDDPTVPGELADGTDAPASPAAAGIAETMGRALAMAAAAANPSRPGDTAEIEAITDAMIRLLVGTPLRSDGQLTIKSLAQEAGLKRNKLTHKHTQAHRPEGPVLCPGAHAGHAAEGGRRAEAANDELQQKLARLRAARDRLRTDVQQLVRVVHVLEVENQQLREAARSNGVVRVLPVQHRPSDR